jgi:mannose-6-phosphate isomerase-like protein (cupin superfamily)
MMELPKHSNEERPWGSFERFTLNEPTTVKIITVSGGKRLSLQKHANRDEFWCIINGSGFVTIGSERKEARIGDEFYIPRGTPHRAEGGTENVRFMEICFGEFDEKDEIRLEDDYGRA